MSELKPSLDEQIKYAETMAQDGILLALSDDERHLRHAILASLRSLRPSPDTASLVKALEAGADALAVVRAHATALPVLHTLLKTAKLGGTDVAEQMWHQTMDLLRKLEKPRGEIVNPHVLEHIRAPQLDFDKMLATLQEPAALLRAHAASMTPIDTKGEGKP